MPGNNFYLSLKVYFYLYTCLFKNNNNTCFSGLEIIIWTSTIQKILFYLVPSQNFSNFVLDYEDSDKATFP